MKLRIVRADPSGNITLFVLTPVAAELRAPLAERLLAIKELGGEQVGYVCDASDCDGRLEMSGGEFCGNASRAFGMLLARERGAEDSTSLRVRISGCERPLCVAVNPAEHTAGSEMPLPRFVRRVTVSGREGTLVHLGGIAHFVTEDTEPSMAFFERVEQELAAELAGLDAYGVVFLDSAALHLTPLVKVPATDSLFWEGSCGSGSVAAICARTEGRPDGEYSETYTQPAGVITACVTRRNGAAAGISVSGGVELGEVTELELSDFD